MTKLGILVGEDNWTFFREIFENLQAHYQTQVYQKRLYRTPFFHQRLNRWAVRQSLRSVLRNNDICFFEWASDLLAPASHLPKECRIITRLHSFELYQWAPKINWAAVDKVILVSQAMRQMFVEHYPDHAHKAVVVYNGRSLEEFRPAAAKPFQFHLGMLGHIAPVKRVYEIVLMLYHLRRQGCDARLYIAGEPAGDLRYAAAVHRLVKQLGLQEQVIFDGYVSKPAAWLQKIDIFISNSYWEGQQVALIEAMSSGCYCLSHGWAGAEEMLPLENLYLTEEELQQKILAYAAMADAEKRQCQQQLRTIACEKFNIMHTKTQIRQMIEEERAKMAGKSRSMSVV